MGLRPPHEAGQRAAEHLLVELDRAIRALQELRRGVAIAGPEGGVGPGAAEPLSYLELTTVAGDVQRCPSMGVGGVVRSTPTVHPLSEVEVTSVAGLVQWCNSIVVGGVESSARAVQPLGDVEVTLEAGLVQWCYSIVVGGVDRSARAVQPLGDAKVTLEAGKAKWLLTTTILRPHARAFRHPCLCCRQIARLHGVEQLRVERLHPHL